MTAAVSKRPFICPDPLRMEFAGILRGHYDIPPITLERPPFIVDCGANVGAFTVWAALKWPGATIDCYEPHPGNAATLRRNVDGLPNITVHEVAIGPRQFEVDGHPSAHLHIGHNEAVHSLFDSTNNAGGESIVVRTLQPADIPPCDILKIDTEGAEPFILTNYPHLSDCKAVMLEWHRAKDKWALGHMLSDLGFRCVYDVQLVREIGEMKWVRETHKQVAS